MVMVRAFSILPQASEWVFEITPCSCDNPFSHVPHALFP